MSGGAASQINITLGTAGHIDHGKTALIKCLTGCDTDRLKEEKQRGMSIDLGFAPCTIADKEVGIVDVPGHENFIKTMVAGATGIDGVIFVIAADDGVMPQTREHLDILTLLGVRHGIVALTKTDCVPPDRLETVTREVRNFLSDTFLQTAPIVPVSNVTGAGLESLLEAIEKLVGSIVPRRTDGVFRMPAERAFSLKGYGTIVAGIPVSGTVKTGDEVVLLPQAVTGRIKAMQVYGRDSDTAMSGQCVAINVPAWDHKLIARGDVVCAPEYFSPQQWYLCRLEVLRNSKLTIKNAAGVKFHTGASEVVATIYLLEGEGIGAGSEGLVQFKLSSPVTAGPCDRFIVRSLSPVQTVAGGVIIEALPAKLRRSHREAVQDAKDRAAAVPDRRDFAEYCVRSSGAGGADERQIALRVKLPTGLAKQILFELVNQGKVLALTPKLYMHKETFEAVAEKLRDILAEFHNSRPESPGMSDQELCRAAGLKKDLFDGVVQLLISQRRLAHRKHRLALPEHCEKFDEDEQKLLDAVESLFRTNLFSPPKCEDIMQHTQVSADKAQRIVRILLEQELLVRVENDLLFHRQAIEQARDTLVSFAKKQGRLESVKFKYLLDTSRKFAIPLLDYFDRIGVTRRVGNTRYLKTPPETS